MSGENNLMPRNVFICSAGHSGSTLLDMLLGSHSSAESLGELVNLPMDMALNRECACGHGMQDCGLWPQVMRRMRVDPIEAPYALRLGYGIAKIGDARRTSSLYRMLTRPKIAMKYYRLRYNLSFLSPFESGFDTGVRNTLEVYDRVRELTGKSIVVDSSKHYVRAASIYLSRPEQTRVVILVRDGRGVFYSGLKRNFGRAYSLQAWRNHYARALELLERRVPETHRILIRYEDMVSNTEQTLSRLCEFLGVEFEPAMLNFRAAVHHNVNGNDMKFSSTSELRLDEAWKTGLKADDLAYFERRAGSLNRRLGYT